MVALAALSIEEEQQPSGRTGCWLLGCLGLENEDFEPMNR